MTLAGKTLFISGGSRGVGLAIAIRAARDGANVALIAKTAEPHPQLEGTVYTAAAQIEAAGGRALPVAGDIRDEAQVMRAVARAVERFGGIDVCVHNASAINLSGTEALEIKRYDLMQSINTRARSWSAGLHPVSEAIGEPAHPDPVPAGQPGAALARPARRLHDRQVRDDPVRPGLRRRVRRGRHRIQRTVAADADRHRRGTEPARRRPGDGPGAQARAVRRRGLRGDHQGQPGLHRERVLCEDVLAAEGVTDFDRYAYQPGIEPEADLFVDHA